MPTATIQEPALLRVEEAARRLGLSRSKTYAPRPAGRASQCVHRAFSPSAGRGPGALDRRTRQRRARGGLTRRKAAGQSRAQRPEGTTMEDIIVGPREGDHSIADLGPTGLSALRKLRSECRGLRERLRECEVRSATIRVITWRPVTDPELVGFADIAIGDLVILGVRLMGRNGAHRLSWPMRSPKGSGSLLPVMVPSTSLDARTLGAILLKAYPECVAP